MASAFVTSAAAMMFEIFRYDSELEQGQYKQLHLQTLRASFRSLNKQQLFHSISRQVRITLK